MSGKYVYGFGGGKADGKADMKELLGGKGANLAEMANLGIPVPPGFTITTEVCNYYYKHKKTYPPQIKNDVKKALANVETIMKAKFGDPENPPAAFHSFRRTIFHARHDGNGFERRS